jgi:hypothetical protein
MRGHYTRPAREVIGSTLANSVGKDARKIYERIDRRRISLVRDIVQKFQAINEMRVICITIIDLEKASQNTE